MPVNMFYSTLLFISALVSAIVASILWQRRIAPGGKPLVVVYALALTWWSATYGLHWAGVYRPTPLFWLNLTYLGAVVGPTAFFVSTIQLSGYSRWLTRPIWILLLLEPALTLLLLWTDPLHGLFFAGLHNPTDNAIYSGGPWFWTNIVYLYGLNLLSLTLLFKTFMASHSKLYRQQLRLVITALLIPQTASVLSFLNWSPWPGLDLTPLTFSISGVVLSIGLLRYQFLNVMPIARASLIENMNDGIVVLDTQNQVIDINPAGGRLLNADITTVTGQSVTSILPDWLKWKTNCNNRQTHRELLVETQKRIYLEARLICLQDAQQRYQGQLIILRDITEQKKLEIEREELITSLQEALGQVKTLEGILPICANCKKIRDEDGNWQQIELYIYNHTKTDFTHSICPECQEKLYPFLK